MARLKFPSVDNQPFTLPLLRLPFAKLATDCSGYIPSRHPMNKAVRFKLFIMMILEIAIWGSWQVQIFNYMPMLGFKGWEQNLAGSMFAIASVVGIFFSN